MKIENNIINILSDSSVEGNILILPEITLDRQTYVKVNKVLESIGGKWNRYKKGHVFDNSPKDILEEILQTGEYTDTKKEYQFFETPEELAKQMVELAGIKEGETVLEPSAGQGAIAKYLPTPDVIELEPNNRKKLTEAGYKLVGDDFLKCQTRYDVIVANPPFSKQQDIDHINHMLDLANRCVVAIASASVLLPDLKLFYKYLSKLLKCDNPQNEKAETSSAFSSFISLSLN